MNKNILKIFVLGILLILCVTQTMRLWLGDMSSHNFLLTKSNTQNEVIVVPKMVWMNTGKFAYNIGEMRVASWWTLLEEIVSKAQGQRLNLEKEEKLSYEEILSMQGVVYEYGVPLSFNEIIGQPILKEDSNLKFKEMFVECGYNEHKTYLYLNSSDNDSLYKVIIPERLEQHQRAIENFKAVSNQVNMVAHQASMNANQKGYTKENVFFPLNSESSPIIYEKLSLYNPVQKETFEETVEALEPYVNQFFENPLLKEVEQAADGNIIFRENMKTSVRYTTTGVLEFNINKVSDANKMTDLEKLTKVQSFVDTCEGIPLYLREGLYLSGIKENTYKKETTYLFDYKYDEFPVLLSSRVKEKLGLEAMLEIVMKNDEIVRGKWSILKIDIDSEGSQSKGEFTKEFNQVVSQIYKDEDMINTGQSQVDYLECGYIIEDLETRLKFDWIVHYKNGDYYF